MYTRYTNTYGCIAPVSKDLIAQPFWSRTLFSCHEMKQNWKPDQEFISGNFRRNPNLLFVHPSFEQSSINLLQKLIQ